jgi:CheY-like chemotaxis protein
LGLSIAKQLAEAMGGGIAAHSVLGSGTTFRVTVQLPGMTGPTVKPLIVEREGLKVLLVVKQSRLRSMAARHLTAAGCRLVLADSQSQAWDEYRRQFADGDHPAVAIVDGLSDPDARSLARQIRGLNAPPPGLILLRRPTPGVLDSDRALFDRIINKPVRGSVLIDAINQLTRANVGAAANAPLEPAPPPVASGPRVLLADDNLVNQMVTTRMLQRCGAQVRCVGNGIEALQALREADFDVIFMDCQMPEMDGFEATRQLRSSEGAFRDPNIPVIALTANAFATDREQCLAAGMNDFLSKPVDRHRLEEALFRALACGPPVPAPQEPAPPTLAAAGPFNAPRDLRRPLPHRAASSDSAYP